MTDGVSVSSSIRLRINGTETELDVDNRTTLLDALRDHVGLTGAKKGCDHGQCGACTVLLDGRRANACLVLAVAAQRYDVTTIEGLGAPGSLHPMQAAFTEHDGFQCGYCTPGQICSATAMLDEARAGWPSAVTDDLAGEPGLTADEIRERMSGNLCRCGAYPNIVAAIEAVRDAEGATAATTRPVGPVGGDGAAAPVTGGHAAAGAAGATGASGSAGAAGVSS